MASQPHDIDIAVAGTALGVMAHAGYFVHGEHHLVALRYLIAALASPPVATCLLVYGLDMPLPWALKAVGTAWLAFLTGVYTSMAIYRAYFHPLRNFPGPGAARYSQFWWAAQLSNTVDQAWRLDRLHARYGEYVRVGPNLLSIADPDLVEAIHGTQSKYEKGDWYDLGRPLTTLQQMRDKAEHDRRRRHGWNKAFTTKSLRAYDSRLVKYSDQLVTELEKRSGQVVNLTDWTAWFAFDIMGDLVFGRSFNTIERAQSHFYLDALHRTAHFNGILATIPWLMQLIVDMLPLSMSPLSALLAYADKCLQQRKTREPAEPDVMSHLLEAGPFFGDAEIDELLLVGDARLLIVAGSDVTATTLLYTLYHLTRKPELMNNLRRELKGVKFTRVDDVTVVGVQNIAYLNAIINEALRLHPPAPGGLYRQTGTEGAVINGQKLPPGVRVIAPQLSIHRSPRAYVQPNDFIPERWTTRPEMILNKQAWAPFSIGKFACIGKQLALNEIRTVICKLVLAFDIDLAPGETGELLLTKSRDTFTMNNEKLEVVVTKRAEQKGKE